MSRRRGRGGLRGRVGARVDALRELWSESRAYAGKALIAGAALLLLLVAVFGDQGLFKMWQLGRERDRFEEKIARLEVETNRLHDQVRALKQGTYPYEKIARERLGLVRPGEIVYDFRSDPLGPAAE